MLDTDIERRFARRNGKTTGVEIVRLVVARAIEADLILL